MRLEGHTHKFTDLLGRSCKLTSEIYPADEDMVAWLHINGLPDSQQPSICLPIDTDEHWLELWAYACAEHDSFRQNMIGRSHTDKSTPKLPNLKLNTQSRQSNIEALIRLGGKARFRDYADLRAGRDEFSRMKLQELMEANDDSEQLIARAASSFAHALQKHKVSGELKDKDHAVLLRWNLRGLPGDMAIHKLLVDREIQHNARKNRK